MSLAPEPPTSSAPPPVPPVPPRKDVPRGRLSLDNYVDALFEQRHLRRVRWRRNTRRVLAALFFLAGLFGATVFAAHRLSQRFACHARHGVYVDGVCLAAARIELP